ncbi:MAG: S8 family serine peptidase, partial [archaeon]
MKPGVYVSVALVLLVLLAGALNATAFYDSMIPLNSLSDKETVYSQNNPSNNLLDSKIHKDLQNKISEAPKEKTVTLFKATNENELDSMEALIESAGGKVLSKNKIGDVITAEIPAEKIPEIVFSDSVESAWPDRVFHATLEESVPQINAPFMWENDLNGSGIKIAVLDTGIDSFHPMLQGKIILENTFTGESAQDVLGHGTHVAGIIAGTTENGGKYNGVAPGALLLNVKVLDNNGYGSESEIINGINWAVDPDGNSETDDGADIINMSLGGPYADLNSPIVSAIKDAIQAGVIVVVASGNCGSGCPSSNCHGFIGVETPGISPEAITVGAVDKQNNWACFSSGGTISENIKPDVVAPGVNINSSVPEGYAAYSGTSMATPHVAGAAALLLQSNENLSPEEVKYVLEATAQKLGEPGKDIKYGSGLIDASKFIPPNVNKLLKYKVELPEIVYLYDEIIISLTPLADSIESAFAVIKDPDNTEYKIQITNTSQNSWQGIFSNTGITGIYSVDIFISNKVGNITEFNENFGAIRFDSNTAFIEQIIASNNVSFDENFSATIVFKNNGSSDVNAIIEAQIIDENILMASIEKNVFAGPNSENYVDFLFGPLETLGSKQILAIASFEGEYHTKEKTFTVTDNTEPVIDSVNFESSVNKNQPAVMELIVEDTSDVNGNLVLTNSLNQLQTIPLKLVWGTGTQKKLTATYYGTNLLGENDFYLEACDSVGLCTSSENYGFTVQDCNNRHVLIVSENESSEPERFTSFLENYCVSLLNTKKSSLPEDSSFFGNFELIIWLTGTRYNENVSNEAAALLLDSNTNIVLEGEDIAFNHFSDEFMAKVANAVFDKELLLKDYNGSVQLEITRNHPLFNSLAVLDFNPVLSLFPDSLIPVNNGVELASWNADGNKSSAIIASNTGSKKTLFLPFSLQALGSKQQIFIQNMLDWMLTDSEQADLVPKLVEVYPSIEGSNFIVLKIENNGAANAVNVRTDIYSDNVLENTLFVESIPVFSSVTRAVSLQLPAGEHEIKVSVNPLFEVTETNYLNNTLSEQINFIPFSADLTVKSVSSSNASNTVINAEIQNIGGSKAENALIQVFYNGTKVSEKTITVNSRETKTVTATTSKKNGVNLIEVKVNPEQTVLEADYSNNSLSKENYICSKSNILVVNDNDSENYSTDNPSSVSAIEEILKNNGYCFEVWSEKEKGVPLLEHLNEFEIVIWSAGNYWNTVIDENDMQLLQEFNGNIIFEGADIGFDHANELFLQEKLHASLDKDLIAQEQES